MSIPVVNQKMKKPRLPRVVITRQATDGDLSVRPSSIETSNEMRWKPQLEVGKVQDKIATTSPPPVSGKGRRPRPDEGAPRGAAVDGATRVRRPNGRSGPFALAAGLDAPGALPIADAVELVQVSLEAQVATGAVDISLAHMNALYMQRFVAYAAGRGIHMLRDVDETLCALWIHSPNTPGYGTVRPDGRPAPVALGTKHSRRSTLRRFLRASRTLGLDDRDPTADLPLPRKPGPYVRPLTEQEVQRCKDASHRTTIETRLPCAFALALAGATTAEIPMITQADVHLAARRIWTHGGGTRTQPRWIELDDWQADMIGRHIGAASDGPRPVKAAAALVYTPRWDGGHPFKRQAAASGAIGDIFRLAGLAATPGIRPSSVIEYVALRLYEETGSLEHVAARLGLRSLDRTAHLVGVDWRGLYELNGPSESAASE